MKRIFLFLVVMLTVAPVLGAITYDQSYYVQNKAYLGAGTSSDPLYNFWGEAENLLEATTGWGNLYLTPTDTEPTATEGRFYYDNSENALKVYTGAAWTAIGSGTFTGGNITSDVTLNASGVDIKGTTTTAHQFQIQGYDVDNTTYRALFDWTNGNTIALILGDPLASFALESTGVDISTAGAVTGVTDLTYSGTVYGPAIKAASAGNVALAIDAAGSGAINIGGTSTGATVFAGNVDIGNAATDTLTITSIIDADVTFDDGATDSPSLILKDATDETATFAKSDGGFVSVTTVAGDGFQVLTGNLKIGNGVPGVAQNGEDAYIEGTLEVDNAVTFDSTLAVTGGVTASSTLGVTGVLTASDALTFSDGLTIDQPANNLLEITENSETLQLGFGTGNTIELGAGGTGVNTIDFNDVDALVDIESIALESGLTITQPADNYFEITENSDTLQIIFGSNIWELGAGGTGVTSIDFNDIDQLVDVEYITGDNGQKIDFSINERVEFGDSEKFGFNLGTSNTVEFVTDTGITTVDCNNMILTDTKVLVTNDTDNEILTVAGSGGVFTNAGAGGAQTFTLPAAAAGLEFTFIVMAAQELRVDPTGDDVVYINAASADAAEYWTANAVGESVHLIAVDATNWIAVSHIGNWTQETP